MDDVEAAYIEDKEEAGGFHVEKLRAHQVLQDLHNTVHIEFVFKTDADTVHLLSLHLLSLSLRSG